MKTICNPAAMQRQAQRWKREGERVALVPTMGALHAGHVSLIPRARKAAGVNGIVVVSIYVNPTQFNVAKDLRSYPRPLAADKKLCYAEGVDVVFAPKSLYENDASTTINETVVSLGMEGESRQGHFRGVGTVVVKLFNLVLPTSAIFGEKDWQQASLIRRVTRDLNLPTRIIIGPTVREADGLACSSRNVFLNKSERQQAAALWQAIGLARAAVHNGNLRGLKRRLIHSIEQQPAAKVDYVEFFDEKMMRPVKPMKGARMALAVFIGKTRLIDNARL
ncbi:pantoate--beta-alanine ligase [Verrucomicrobia bacterium]|nr:pantoate--beta-alanine ligase [Verrucomicrobiota bacterium]MDC0219932.1 pantoate--beta-alanine ligase [Verrucomicrobiota bacterium]